MPVLGTQDSVGVPFDQILESVIGFVNNFNVVAVGH